jgi:hypothetical protein
VVARDDDDRVVQLSHVGQRLPDALNALVDAEQHLESVANVLVGRSGSRADGWQPGDGALDCGLASYCGRRVRPPRDHRLREPTSVPLGRDEASPLISELRHAAVVALLHVGMERLVREEDHERPSP